MTLHPFTIRAMRGAALALLTALAACGGGSSEPSSGSGNPDPAGNPPPASFTIALSTQKAVIFQGASATLDATVTRDAGFDGAVDVAVTGLPSGVSAAAVNIAKGETTAHITLQAAAAAPHSLPTDAVVQGVSGSVSAQQPVTVTVTVRGLASALDTSFASNGKAITGIGSDDYAEAMAVQPDGKLVVVGHANMGGTTGTDFVLVRYLRDGAIDTSFGTAGKVSTDIDGGSDQAFAVALQGDGKIVVAGSHDESPKGKSFAVVRYNADGSLDTTFGNGGKVVTSFGSQSDTAYAVVVQPDGKIVAGGHANTATRGIDFALARYETSGALDASFGNNGQVVTPIRALDSRDSIYALALQTTGGEVKIVAVGGEGDFIITRYNANGSVDAGFAIGQQPDGVFGSVIGAARAVTVTPDNKIVVAGHVDHDFALLQLTEDGIADVSFGGGAGRVITQVSATNWDEAHAVVRQADGKLVVGGWVYAGNGSSGDFALVRYNTDGTLDAGFGSGGITVTAVAPGTKADEGRALVLQADERVPTVRSVLAGSANDANYDIAVTRYWH